MFFFSPLDFIWTLPGLISDHTALCHFLSLGWSFCQSVGGFFLAPCVRLLEHRGSCHAEVWVTAVTRGKFAYLVGSEYGVRTAGGGVVHPSVVCAYFMVNRPTMDVET